MVYRISLIANVVLFITAVGIGTTLYVANEKLEEATGRLKTAMEAPPKIEYIEVVKPIEPTALEYVTPTSLNELEKLLVELENRMSEAHAMAMAARSLGYDENHPVIVLAKEEWHSANSIYLQYKEDYNILYNSFWDEKAAEYPTATYIWFYLKEMDFNDYVCAGIMGNLMAEVGGQTLKLNDRLYTSDKKHGGFYGICQWSSLYYPQIHNADLETQCEFLKNTIQEEFEDFGDNYSRGFDYNSFLKMTDERDAALAFAKVYERCGKSTYGIRQSNAEVAYNYFTT